MLDKYNKYKALKLFLDFPTENFRLREIARLTKISPPSIMNYLKEFEKDLLIKKQIKRNIPFYIALRDNSNFILYKKISILFELNHCGLIDYLWDKLSPQAIILYGSFARGESIEGSDIDLFILTKEREDFVKSIDHNKFSTNAVENYYEIIKELAGALLLLDGLKSIGDYAHKDLIDYLINYREFQQKDIIFMNDLRIKRNNSFYEGKKIDPIYLINNKDNLLNIIERLKKLVKSKI